MVKDSAMDTQRKPVSELELNVWLWSGRWVREPGLGPGERLERLF